MLASTLLIPLLLLGNIECSSTAHCNRLGTDALKVSDFDAARALFAQQIDRAQTSLREAEDDRAAAALQIALNNAALTELRAGECLRAHAWLRAADPQHRATTANLRQLQQRCGTDLDGVVHIGEFWQYAGHGAWNSISIREAGNASLRLDAFWMRIGRAPLQDYGPAAMGELSNVSLRVNGDTATGLFEANEPDIECRVRIHWVAGGLTVEHTDAQACYTGGADSVLKGDFRRVGAPAELPDEEDTR